MVYPYQFTFTGSGAEYGILWNPWGTTPPATALDNLILTLMPDLAGALLLPPAGPFWVVGMSALVGSGGNGAFTLGWYDTVTAAFVALYPVPSTAVAGGGLLGPFGDGLYIPAGATKLPVLRYDGSGGATVSGHMDLWFSPVLTASGLPSFDPVQDEAGAPILDELGNVVYSN